MRSKVANRIATLKWVLAFAATGASGCGDSTAMGDGAVVNDAADLPRVLTPPSLCSNAGLNQIQDGFWKLFQCGSIVSIGLGTHSPNADVDDVNAQLQLVVNRWNAALSDQDVGLSIPLNLPRMSLSQGAGKITVNFGSNEPIDNPSTRYCGTADPCFEGGNCSTSNAATINGAENLNNCTGNYTYYSSLNTWLSHEVSHALGFTSGTYHSLDTPHDGHCLVSLSGVVAPTQFGTGCQYEIEKIFYRYGIRQTNPDPAKHIVTGLQLSGVPILPPRGTATLTVNKLVFEKANAASLCPTMSSPSNTKSPSSLDLRFVGCTALLSPAGYAFTSTSSDPLVASVGSFNGASAPLTAGTKFGSTVVTVMVNPGVHQLATLFGRVYPNVATVTVSGTLAISAGNNQTANAGSTLPVAPSVRVADLNNNPVSGIAVTFAVTSGGGTVTGATTTTNTSGIAQVGSWRLGSTPGTNSLGVTVPGLSPVSFTATGIVPFVVTATAPQHVTNKATYPLTGSASNWATNWRWDRSDNNGATWYLWANSQNSSFISYFGCYTIYWRLTATRASDGVVRSGTATTTVANTSGCEPQ